MLQKKSRQKTCGEYSYWKMLPKWETSFSATLQVKGETLNCCKGFLLISGTNNGFDFCSQTFNCKSAAVANSGF
jgi:hypothetical protein